MSKHTIKDIDGIEHTVYVRQSGNGYTAMERYSQKGCSGSNSSDGSTIEEALSGMKRCADQNASANFDALSDVEKERILTYIRENFEHVSRGGDDYSSYYLKHVVERGIGDYVSNGELKGAMKHAGYETTKDTSLSDINYSYRLKKFHDPSHGPYLGRKIKGMHTVAVHKTYEHLNQNAIQPSPKIVKHKSTVSPFECTNCRACWYGQLVPIDEYNKDMVFCTKCWVQRDNYYLDMCYKGMANQDTRQQIFQQWLEDNDRMKKPDDRKFHSSVPGWMRNAILSGQVKPNDDLIYVVSSRDDDVISVEALTRDEFHQQKMERLNARYSKTIALQPYTPYTVVRLRPTTV